MGCVSFRLPWGMHTILTRSLAAIGVAGCVVFGLDATPRAQAKPAACAGDEGATLTTALGVELCSGTSQTKVATFDAPQSGARVAATLESGLGHRAGDSSQDRG